MALHCTFVWIALMVLTVGVVPSSTTTTVKQCSSSNYCPGPVPDGTKGESCACPATYMNIGNCCLSQYWIIGLAAASGFILLIIILVLIIHICYNKSKMKARNNSSDDRSLLYVNGHNMDLTNENIGTDNMKIPPVDNNLVISPALTVDVDAPEDVTPNLNQPRRASRQEEAVVIVPVLNNPPEPVIARDPVDVTEYDGGIKVSIKELQAASASTTFNGQPRPFSYASPTAIEQISLKTDNSILPPVTPAIRGSDAATNFYPRLDNVDSTTDYSIKRPTVLL